MIDNTAKVNGLVFQLLNGIQKIKTTGAEKRAFSVWAKTYHAVAESLIKLSPCAFLMLAGLALLYYIAGKNQITLAQFMAFSASYCLLSSALNSFDALTPAIANIKAIFHLISPLMLAAPEVADDKKMMNRPFHSEGKVESASGTGIELNNVTFRYNENTPPIIDNLSLKIKRGDYIALVGKSGCGKSTLLRLLLGFEKPLRGSIYYDGADLESMDKRAVRRNIGTVLQNGKLLSGSIFENIALAAGNITIEDAWNAAELAGIAADIREMPMAMFTMVGDGLGGISGGQAQRILIARAIAAKPNILIFDEATSALDNTNQKKIGASLGALNITRIVIAHRLSTIRLCNRIIVLDAGKIAEEGSYDELIENKGLFAALMLHQTQ
jgi:ABC-type bacteriocin/lantibiotic exporter with double-glycine peptidase domain